MIGASWRIYMRRLAYAGIEGDAFIASQLSDTSPGWCQFEHREIAVRTRVCGRYCSLSLRCRCLSEAMWKSLRI